MFDRGFSTDKRTNRAQQQTDGQQVASFQSDFAFDMSLIEIQSWLCQLLTIVCSTEITNYCELFVASTKQLEEFLYAAPLRNCDL